MKIEARGAAIVAADWTKRHAVYNPLKDTVTYAGRVDQYDLSTLGKILRAETVPETVPQPVDCHRLPGVRRRVVVG
ncbi:hypothetical protein [Streptomyces sp. SID3343]|uniref:hypothetical protein n=1 Tax=Streptomyces sp. SID3343 TaxID=2690260 RepID=UPI001368B61B|nr:hypothetical protein [Streptomyces sp. SID3343]MYW01235.1 hypothetical protein [Streptomyces sp. SID3343]